jgi:hypothetical protein
MHLFPPDGSVLRFEGLRSFIAKSDATAVIVDSKFPAASFDLPPILCARKLEIGGVVLCRLSLLDLGKCGPNIKRSN